MAPTPPADGARRDFTVALAVWVVLATVFAVLLSSPVPQPVGEVAGGVGLVVAGLTATACGAWRSSRTRGARRRAWALLSLAGLIVVAGNTFAVLVGADTLASPSLTSDLSVALGYLVSIPALLAFPGSRRAGTRLMIVLDGLVAGSALLLIVSSLVYPRILDAPARESAASQIVGYLFPGLDVVVGTVAILLVMRASRADRLMLGLVAAGFLLYAAADLAYAAQVADGTFAFGTLLNLGWIVGYLTLGLAAWAPGDRPAPGASRTRQRAARAVLSDVPGTTLLFSLVVVAAVVQVTSDRTGALAGAQSAVWVVLIAAAATRQVLLIRANQTLRRSLEQQVLDRTSDLRRLARQNEILVTSVADGVYGVDPEGRITFANPSAVAMLGYPLERLVGASAHQLFHSPAPDGEPYPWSGCYEHEAITNGGLARGEEDDYVDARGVVLPVEITASPLVDADVVRGAVVVFRDITQRREVDRMKDEFLSVVSHELRTPLTSIRGSLGLLSGGQLGELPSSAGQLVSVARHSTERLVRLVDDLLSLERAGAGAEPLVLSHLEARHLLEAVAAQVDGLADPAGVRVEVDPGATGSLHADEDKMMPVMLNLTANSIKFSEPGAVVRLDARTTEEGLHLAVEDHGRGIPEHKLESVFTRFEQVDSSDSRQKGGAGLGLTISRAIVDQHGGRIWMTSELGHGTTAHVTLPGTDRRGSERLSAVRAG